MALQPAGASSVTLFDQGYTESRMHGRVHDGLHEKGRNSCGALAGEYTDAHTAAAALQVGAVATTETQQERKITVCNMQGGCTALKLLCWEGRAFKTCHTHALTRSQAGGAQGAEVRNAE